MPAVAGVLLDHVDQDTAEAMVDGVRCLAGRELVPWLRTLDGDMVPKDAAKDVLERFTTYRATAWQDAQNRRGVTIAHVRFRR